ncbi:MAG: nitroreductase family protein [Microscillaceae bacterium]|jgi:nitroreductase|nr:nitroreductase family protein [Microscillaceae bacterium]
MKQSTTFIPYQREIFAPETVLSKSLDFYQLMNQRRTVREFSSQLIAKEVIENLIKTASTAPSGAHKQPWTFCAVSNPDLKHQIRLAAEAEEYENYHGRMPEEWLEDLKLFATDEHKPFLEIAPWLIVVFRKIYDEVDGQKRNNYYVNESVGLACGLLLAAIHQAGLVALTHTPSPMNFLAKVLNRPANEKPFLLIPVGYPAENTQVPDLKRKDLDEVSVFFE